MSDNGSGVYQVNSTGQPVVTDTPIMASVFNAYTADAATALSNRIAKDGQTTVTANIPFGGYKLTGVGAATARTDAATIATIQDGTGVYVGTVAGTANAITLTPSPAIAAYVDGQTFRFLASGSNTTSVTVAVSGLAAKNILRAYRDSGSAALLAAGDLSTGQMITIVYRSGSFQLEPYQHPVWLNWPSAPSVGGSATYTMQTGTYARHGPMMHFAVTLIINSIGTGSQVAISNFPANAVASSVFPVFWADAATSIVTCVGVLSGTTLTLYSLTAAGASLTSANNILQNGTSIYVTGSYLTSDA